MIVTVQKTNLVEGAVDEEPKVGTSLWVYNPETDELKLRTSSLKSVERFEGGWICKTQNSTYVVKRVK